MIDQGFRVFLDLNSFSDFQDFLDLGFSGLLDLVFRWIFIHSFSSVFLRIIGFSAILYQSYLTIQTYNPKVFTAREETLYLKDAVFTDAIVDLRMCYCQRDRRFGIAHKLAYFVVLKVVETKDLPYVKLRKQNSAHYRWNKGDR